MERERFGELGLGRRTPTPGQLPAAICYMLYAASIKTPFLYRVDKSRVTPGEHHGLSLQNPAQNQRQDPPGDALGRLW